MFSHCLYELGGSVRKNVTSPQTTRIQRWTEVLRAWKNTAQKRFKATDDSKKKKKGNVGDMARAQG